MSKDMGSPGTTPPAVSAVTSGHTPGPWACEEVRTSVGRAFRIGAGEMLVPGKGCCIIYDDYPGNPANARAANARLIAAAPDLLEALKEARQLVMDWAAYAGDYFREKHGLADDIAKLDAAIAKATGQ